MKDILTAIQEGISKIVSEFAAKVVKPTYLEYNWNGQLLLLNETNNIGNIVNNARILPLNANVF